MFSASTTELYFPKPHNRVITNTIKFTNNTSVDAVIKMRTTSREKFHVRPRIFAIRRGESVEVSVSSRILPADLPEIADKSDECHAVIHQLVKPSSSSSLTSEGGVFSSPEALQLAWDAGQHLGRVVLRCHVSEPPSGHKLTFASASADQQKTANGFPRSKSGSLTRNDNSVNEMMNASSGSHPGNASQHTRGPSDASVASGGGKPPLSSSSTQQHRRSSSSVGNNNNMTASVRSINSAHNQYQRDQDVQQYQNSSSKNSFNGASLERLSQKVQQHEHALDKNAHQLHSLSETAKIAAKNVEAAVLARERRVAAEEEEQKNSNIDKHGRVKRVPLSVAVFFMVLAFLAGVLLKQSAYQHHLDQLMA